jgi:hypothetical protein
MSRHVLMLVDPSHLLPKENATLAKKSFYVPGSSFAERRVASLGQLGSDRFEILAKSLP